MSTVDIDHVRRRLDSYLAATSAPLGDAEPDRIPARLVLDAERRWRAADALLVYLPLLLDEVGDLRRELAAYVAGGETIESVSEAARWIRDERDQAEQALAEVLALLDESGQDFDPDMVRQSVPDVLRHRLAAMVAAIVTEVDRDQN